MKTNRRIQATGRIATLVAAALALLLGAAPAAQARDRDADRGVRGHRNGHARGHHVVTIDRKAKHHRNERWHREHDRHGRWYRAHDRHDRWHRKHDRRHDRWHRANDRHDRRHHVHHRHHRRDVVGVHPHARHQRRARTVHVHEQGRYYCQPCRHYFKARHDFHDHLHRHHHVPIWRLPFVIVRSAVGWIFYG